MNIRAKVKHLFDYQRFEQNSKLQKIILNEDLQSDKSLSDEDLSFVAAAGNKNCEPDLLKI